MKKINRNIKVKDAIIPLTLIQNDHFICYYFINSLFNYVRQFNIFSVTEIDFVSLYLTFSTYNKSLLKQLSGISSY